MIVTELAEGSVAEHVGYLIGLIGIPLVGAVLLIAGLRRRSQRRSLPPTGNPMVSPGYPPPPVAYGYPPPAPPNPAYAGPPGPPTFPPYYPAGYPVPRPCASSGTALIVVGSLLLAFGVLGIVGNASHVLRHVERAAGSAKIGQ